MTPCHPRGARAGSGGRGQRPGAACGVWQSEQTHSWGLRSGPFGALDAHAAPFPIPWAVTATTSPGLGGQHPPGDSPQGALALCPHAGHQSSPVWLFQLPKGRIPASLSSIPVTRALCRGPPWLPLSGGRIWLWALSTGSAVGPPALPACPHPTSCRSCLGSLARGCIGLPRPVGFGFAPCNAAFFSQSL